MAKGNFFLMVLRGGLKVLLPVLALVIGIASLVYLRASTPEPPKSKARETVHSIRTQKVALRDHHPLLRLYGEVTPGRKVDLRALVAGKIVESGVNLLEGARVEKGELLLRVDPFSYKGAVVEAKAKIAEAKARLLEVSAQIKAEEDSITFAKEQLKLSEVDYARARRLEQRGSASRQGSEQRQYIVSQRSQVLQGKRANLIALKAKSTQQKAAIDSLNWRLRQARRNERDTSLNAPFSGYLSEVNANLGKLVNINDKIATLLDDSRMDVAFTLSDRQYGRLIEAGGMKGRSLRVRWKLGDKTLSYDAVIERVAAKISSDTGGVAVYGRIKDPQKPRPLRAGAFVDVELPDRTFENSVRLPQTALFGRTKVYVVGPQNRLEERRVTLLAIDGADVLVRGALKAGDKVVTTRLSTIGGGMKVRDVGAAKKSSGERQGREKNKRGAPVSKAITAEQGRG